MKLGELVHIRIPSMWIAPSGFEDGQVGIIIEQLDKDAYAVLVKGQRFHYHKHVLEPVDETR